MQNELRVVAPNASTAYDRSFGDRRFLALDGWRGICALLVALLHFHTTGSIGSLRIVAHGHLFVDFFFVLSGFVVTHAYLNRLHTPRDAGFMLWRRIGRLWPLHLATLAALISLELASPIIEFLTGSQRSASSAFAPDSSASLASIPTNIFLLNGLGIHDQLTWNIPSWSISVEFWTYVLFALIAILSRGRTLLLAVALVVLGIAVVASFSPALMATENGWGFFRCLAGFFAGHIVYRFLIDPPTDMRLPKVTPNALEFMAASGALLFVAFGGGTQLEFAAPLVFGCVVWVFAHEQGALSVVLKWRWLQLLGLWSYSIYMVHTIIIMVTHRVLSVVGQLADQQLTFQTETPAGIQHTISFASGTVMDLVTLLYIAVVVAVSACTWRWIEMPANRFWNGPLWDWVKSRSTASRPATPVEST